MRLEWLGTAGFRLEAEGEILLVDPYLSRLSIGQCLIGAVKPDKDLLKQHFPKARAILVGHSHFDHALDVPFIAAHTGAQVYGARSTVNFCLASGLSASQVTEIRPGMFFENGPFRVQVIGGEHGKLIRGKTVPYAGDIESCESVPTTVTGFKCGQVNWFHVQAGGQSFMHHGSAELSTDTPTFTVDNLLTCVAGWHYAEALHTRLLRHFNPGRIFICHYDNFFKPIQQGDIPLPLVKLPHFVDGFLQEDKDAKVYTLAPMTPVTLAPP